MSDETAVKAAENALRGFLEPWLALSVHGTPLEYQIHAAAVVAVRDALEAIRPELEAEITRQIEPLFNAFADLLCVVADECPLTDAVMAAAGKVRAAMIAHAERDTGPPPA